MLLTYLFDVLIVFEGDREAAMQYYRQGLKLDPENQKLKDAFRSIKNFNKHHTKADEFFAANQYENALQSYQKALESLPEAGYALLVRVVEQILTITCRRGYR